MRYLRATRARLFRRLRASLPGRERRRGADRLTRCASPACLRRANVRVDYERLTRAGPLALLPEAGDLALCRDHATDLGREALVVRTELL
jgi:hypothetical protein